MFENINPKPVQSEVILNYAPSTNILLLLVSSNPSVMQIATNPSTLLFTPSTWYILQVQLIKRSSKEIFKTFDVIAAENYIAEGNITVYSLVQFQNGTTLAKIPFTIIDDDSPGLNITAVSGTVSGIFYAIFFS